MRTASLAKPKTRKKITGAKNVTYCFSVDQAPPDQCFWVNYGPVVKDIPELKIALKEMTDEQFRFHAMDRGVNDFAKWVEDVLGHVSCAQKLSRAKTKEASIRALATCSDK